MEKFHFLRPEWFYALIPLALILYYALNHSLGSVSWKKVCDAKLLPYILIGGDKPISRLPYIVTAIAALLCIVAAAGPVWKKLPTPVFRDQSSLIIALDLSRSMDSSDIRPSRITRAKLKIIDLLQKRQGGQTALIAYAASAFTVTPLTTDTSTIVNLISALDTQIMPAQGSDASKALRLANELLAQASVTDGDVLLITDNINKSDFVAVSELSKNNHRLSILGVGTKEGGPIALGGGFFKDSNGSIVISKLNASILQEAALLGQGLYTDIDAGEKDVEALSTLFNSKNTKKNAEKTELTADIWHEEGPILLLFVLPLVALLSRRGLLTVVIIILSPLPEPAYAFNFDSLWLNKDQRAMQHFKKGETDKAAELFRENNWKATAHYRNGEYEKAIQAFEASGEAPTSNQLYNTGNALAHLGRYQESVNAYDEAIKLDPSNSDAIHNRKIVEKKLEEQQPKQNNNAKSDNKEESPDKADKSDMQSAKKNQTGQNKKEDQNNDAKNNDQKNGQNNKQENKDAQNKKDQQQDSESDEKIGSKQEDADNKDQPLEQQETNQQESYELSEEEQANAQWLKRIVDDPGGLLRRKFIYQYKQMPGQHQSKQPW